MKLLGGSARGMSLATVPGRDTRPALARVRKSLFDILAPRLEGARALDLFAGTGSLGLESLSRGAASAVFVDDDRRCCEAIRESLQKMRMADRAEVVCGDAFKHLWGSMREHGGAPQMFDVVFIAPPYALCRGATEERMVGLVEAILAEGLAPDGRIVLEHRLREGLVREPAGGVPADRREYGQTVLSFFRGRGPLTS